MNTIKKIVYGDEKLTLKEQVDLADDLLDIYITQVNDLLPDVDLWMSGSVLHNSLSVGCGEGVKIQLLSRKNVIENIENCSSCGRKHEDIVIQWELERYIRAGKERLKKA